MNQQDARQNSCNAWIEIFSRLGKDGVPSLERLEQITSDDVRFVDPFNDLVGRPALQRLLEHTRSHIANVRFEVFDIAQSGTTPI